MRCGWCETHNPPDRDGCVNCGGPLRRLSDALTARPPPSPRTVPGAFVRRAIREEAWFGGMFVAIGAGVSLLFLVCSPLFFPLLFGLPITLLFVAVGLGIAGSGWRRAQRRVTVLRDGTISPGEVVGVVRQGEGWRLTYRFDAGGQPREQSVLSTDAEITRFVPGFPVHVVHLGANSDVWPPFG